MRRVLARLPLLVLAAAGLLHAQAPKKYTGPKPPKTDMPYLLHASNLVPLEKGSAAEESRKDETANVVKGAASTARTPLAEPIFLLASEKLVPEKLELYRVTVSKSGNREVAVPKNAKKMKDAVKPIRLSVRSTSRVSCLMRRVFSQSVASSHHGQPGLMKRRMVGMDLKSEI